jgi:hypothetical protein
MSQQGYNKSNSYFVGMSQLTPYGEIQRLTSLQRQTSVQEHPDPTATSQTVSTSTLQGLSEPNSRVQVQGASTMQNPSSPQQTVLELLGPTAIAQQAIDALPGPNIRVPSVVPMMPTLSSQPAIQGPSEITVYPIAKYREPGLFWVIMPDGSEDSWRNDGIQSKTISIVTKEISDVVQRKDIEKLKISLKVALGASVRTKTMRIYCDEESHWKSINATFDGIIMEGNDSDMGIPWEIRIEPLYKQNALMGNGAGN